MGINFDDLDTNPADDLGARINAAQARFLKADPLDVAEYDAAQKALAALKAEVGNARVRAEAHVVNGGENMQLKKTCPKCFGRGYRTYGYVNVQTYPCNWCHRTGKVTEKREKDIYQAQRAEVTRQRNVQNKTREFVAQHKDEMAHMHEASQHSTFMASLRDQLNSKGQLSERQLDAIRNAMAKKAAAIAAKEAARPVVDISAIEALFDTARGNGLKRLAFRTEHIDISAAKENSANPGALYVKHDGEYVGKIAGGKFHATRAARTDTLTLIEAVAVDPMGQAVMYGRAVGRCSCCGRELTDPKSIEMGIGPICAEKWGL